MMRTVVESMKEYNSSAAEDVEIRMGGDIFTEYYRSIRWAVVDESCDVFIYSRISISRIVKGYMLTP